MGETYKKRFVKTKSGRLLHIREPMTHTTLCGISYTFGERSVPDSREQSGNVCHKCHSIQKSKGN